MLLYSAFVVLAVFIFILDARLGLPRVPDLSLPDHDLPPSADPSRLSVIVPARNEERDIEACLRSLLAQDWPALEIIAVNDRSTDRTGEIMDRLAADAVGRLRVLHVEELPGGWLGKTHAMWLAARASGGEWLLFTDGDVLFRADALRRALSWAEATGGDHMVLLPTFITKSFGERLVIANFQMSYLAVRPWKVPDPRSRAHIGVGAFNMVRRNAYEAVGTFESLRMLVVEDVLFGRRLKQAGFAARVAYGHGMVRVHWAPGMIGLLHNMSKSIFSLLEYRWSVALLLAAVVLAVHALPFALVWVATGWARLLLAAALAGLLYMYVLLYRFNRISPGFFLLHPVSTLLGVYAIARSVVQATLGGGVKWRGTSYPLADLKAAARQRGRAGAASRK
jgi:glycosyltransferase involved in cell wall biosynthesis